MSEAETPLLSIQPAALDILVHQGATFSVQITWREYDEATQEAGDPLDLTGYTARMHIRETVNAAGTPISTLTTENGGITLGGVLGTIALFISAVDTAAFSLNTMYYDLEVVSAGGTVVPLLAGKFKTTDEVTR